MKRSMTAVVAFTVALTVSLTVLALLLVRSVTAPSCYIRVGEICVTRAAGEKLTFKGVEVSRHIESEQYTLSFLGVSGKTSDLIVVRDDSLGLIEELSKRAPITSRIETRMWNGTHSSTYFINGSVPGVTPKICVESFFGPQCGGSGTLTRLTPYGG